MSTQRVNLEVALTAGPVQRGSREAETAFQRATRAARELTGASGRVDTSWQTLMGTATRLAGVLGVAFGVREVVRFGRATVQASEELDVTTARLATSVERLGMEWVTTRSHVEAAADALWDTHRMTGGEVMDTLQSLIAVTGDYGASLEAVGVVADVAAELEMDRATAARYVGRIMAGETQVLRRYGVTLSESGDALAELEARFGGAAAAAMSGRDVMTSAMGDFREIFGAVLRDIGGGVLTVESMADAVRDATRWIQENREALVFWGSVGIEVARRIGGGVGDVVRMVFNLGTALGANLDMIFSTAAAVIQDRLNEIIRAYNRTTATLSRLPGIDIDPIAELDSSRAWARAERAADGLRDAMGRIGGAAGDLVGRFRDFSVEVGESESAVGRLANHTSQVADETERAARAEGDRLRLLTRAVELGVATARETVELLVAERQLLAVYRDQTRSLQERVEAADALRRLSGITRFQVAPLASSGIQSPAGGLITEASGRVSTFASPEEARAAADALREAGDGLGVIARWGPDVRATTEGLVALADGMGFLEDNSRRALRGLVDVIRGLDGMGSAGSRSELISSVAMVAGGGIGIAAGILGGLVGRSRRRREERQAAAARAEAELAREAARMAAEAERAADSLARFTAGLREVGRFEGLAGDLERQVREALQAALQAAPQAERRVVFDGDVMTWLEMMEARIETDGIAAVLRELAALEEQFGSGGFNPFGDVDFGAILRDWETAAARIEQLRQAEIASMGDDLSIRILMAQGREDEAAAGREALEIAGLMARARELESAEMEAQVEVLAELLATRRAELAAERERERIMEERLELFSLEAREARLAGDAQRARVAELRARAEEELAAARRLVADGQRTEEWFRRLAAIIDGELNQALRDMARESRDAARAAWEAAAAEAARRDDEMDRLRLRILRAQGRDSEAAALERTMELQAAVRSGADSAFLALLRQAQAEEARARATESATRATDRMTESLSSAAGNLNAPSGLPATLLRIRALNAVAGGAAPGMALAAASAGGGVQRVEYNFGGLTVVAAPGQDPDRLLDEILAAANRRAQDGAGDVFQVGEAVLG